ncbi:MAG: HD domain-containing protein [Lachnospiraceae bacterium]
MATKKVEEVKQMDPREAIITSLQKTKREGVEGLIEFMEEVGFFTAPCSGGNHLCKEGGLAEHSMNVMFTAERLSVSLVGGSNITEEFRNALVIASVLHDLGKCGDFEKALYVPNILKSGKQSDNKPFMRNKNLSNVPHAIRSIKLATLFIDLTEDEEWAILTHDGLYDFMKYEMMGHETQLSMIIHWADMWSSKVIEKTGEEGEE